MGLKLFRLFHQPTNPDKLLGGRYKIISKLGEGGFGQTFLANDLHLPGHPQCVVKQLKPQVSNPDQLQTARRLFDIEASVLYQLGDHDQIPRLLAHFEDNQEFYLAQELIEGEPLNRELVGGQPWSEKQVIALLQDLLHVLAFVHQQQVIHRDIKPSNLIRRRHDGKIVLIDFGAVKQVSTQVVNAKTGQTKTISIGTQGYTPKEQLGGNPRFSSDIYAVGIIGIQALTRMHPRRLQEDPQTGEIDWRNQATQVSPELAAILDRMVRYDFRVRYPTATEALEAIQNLPTALIADVPLPQQFSEIREVLPNQEPQSQTPATESTGTGTNLSSTNIWTPTEPPVHPQPTTNNSPSGASQHQLQHSQLSGSSAPMSATPGLIQRRWVKSWSIPAILAAVGVTFLVAKPLLSPQLTNQIVERNRVSVESPTPSPAQKPTSLSSASPAAESLTQKSASRSPTSPAIKSSTPSPTQKSTPPSPGSIASAIRVSPTPVALVAKPKPKPTPPPAKPTPTPQAAELLSQADRFREIGQYQKAVELYDQAIARKPDIAQAYWGRCYSLNSLQQPAEAIASCNKALDLNPNYPVALWSKGNALDQQQRPMDALKLYEQATTLKPDFAEAWNNQGVALLALDRSTEAIAAFDKATALKPGFADAWANQGAALWKLGRFDRAIASLDQALKLQPNNPTAINLRQQAREKLGR